MRSEFVHCILEERKKLVRMLDARCSTVQFTRRMYRETVSKCMARRRRGYVNIWCGIPAISGNIHNETLMQISLSLETRGRDRERDTQRGTVQ
jgi:hypothetical protein